jgi:hypothetical protein
MTTVDHVTDAGALGRPTPAGTRPAPGAARAQAAGAAWQAVFDRARDGARQDGPRSASPEGMPGATGDVGWRRTAAAVAGPAAAEEGAPRPADSLPGKGMSVDVDVDVDVDGIEARAFEELAPRAAVEASDAMPAGAQQPAVAVARAPAAPPPPAGADPGHGPAPVPAPRLADPQAVPAPRLADPQAAPARDVVSVVIDGRAVAITVRDDAVSDHEALHAAFEAARIVMGEGRALRELTLNGRLLYRRAGGEEGPAPPPGSFAC